MKKTRQKVKKAKKNYNLYQQACRFKMEVKMFMVFNV